MEASGDSDVSDLQKITTKNKGKLFRPSFNDVAGLGDIYNERSDTFPDVGGTPKCTMPGIHIEIEEVPNECKAIPNECWSTKFAALHIPVNTQLSILSQLVKNEETGRCFTYAKEDERRYESVLVYQFKTVTVRVEFCSDDLSYFILTNKIERSNCTHIVDEINWGTNIFLTLEVSKDADSNPDETNLKMEHLFNVACIMFNEGSKKIEREIPNDKFDPIWITLHSSLFPENKVIHTFMELQSAINSIHALTRKLNCGKGSILSYGMIPVSLIQDQPQSNDIADSVLVKTTSKFVQLFDNMISLKRNIPEMRIERKFQEVFFSNDEIASHFKFQSECTSIELRWRTELQSTVLKVRSGESDQMALITLLGGFKEELDTLKTQKELCPIWNRRNMMIEFINEMVSRNVPFITSTEQFDELHCKNPDKNVYLLIHNKTLVFHDFQKWKIEFDLFLEIIDFGNLTETYAIILNDMFSRFDDSSTKIQHWLNKQIVTDDVKHALEITKDSCVAFSLTMCTDPLFEKSNKRGAVNLKCPGTFRKKGPCSKKDRIWQCIKCSETLQYDFAGYFYCLCGAALCSSFQFKCMESSKHKHKYLKYEDEELLNKMLKKIKPFQELNILILGETGVGKSTWINGFANYLTYPTLELAMNNDLICLIPVSFTMVNSDFKSVKINIGKQNRDEVFSDGQSSTQMPKSYIFFINDIRVCLIDTPGMGDTRSIEQDRKNFQNIMTHLSYVSELHGICILLKPNNSRLTVMFEFCIKELLTHLHKDASKNIVFVFTNARSTDYMPGDTFPVLKRLLDEKLPGVIELNKDTVYCLDNESVRFLAVYKQEKDLDKSKQELYSKSWEASVNEIKRLVESITKLQAHETGNTISLNNVRRMILELTKPLAEISHNIEEKIKVLESKKGEIDTLVKNKQSLKGKLFIPDIELKRKPIDEPRTVCNNASCVAYHTNADGTSTKDFKTVCHFNCRLSDVLPEIFPEPELKRCVAMVNQLTCKICGCSWEKHMHIRYELERINIQKKCTEVEQRIKNGDNAIIIVQQFIKELDKGMKDVKKEQQIIMETAAKFGRFLKCNAITPYNDAIENYLQYQIKMEKDLVQSGVNNSKLEQLQNILARYKEEVDILEACMQSAGPIAKCASDDIPRLISSLYDLPICGKNLKGLVEVTSVTNVSMSNKQMVVFERPKNAVQTTFTYFGNAIWSGIGIIKKKMKSRTK